MLTTILAALTLAATPTQDLRVDLRLVTPANIESGEPLRVEARLTNTSRTRSHHVVKSGDGSEVGWREPFVFFTGEVLDGRRWRPLAKGKGGRCGLFDPDWKKDVVRLAPRASIPLTWIASPGWALNLPESGKVRIRVHYSWLSKPTTRTKVDPSGTDMAGVAPFERVSAPVEITIFPKRR